MGPKDQGPLKYNPGPEFRTAGIGVVMGPKLFFPREAVGLFRLALYFPLHNGNCCIRGNTGPLLLDP